MPSGNSPATDEITLDRSSTDTDPVASGVSDPAASAASDPANSVACDPVEWGPVRYDRLRSLFAGVGVVVLLALITLVATVAGGLLMAAVSGSFTFGSGWVLVVLLLIGGPLSIIYVLVGLDRSTPEGRRSLLKGFDHYTAVPRHLRPGWTLAGVGGMGTIWLVGPSWLTNGLWLLFPLIWFVPAMAGYNGATVRVDPASRVVERTIASTDRSGTDDLDAVIRTRRIDLPWTTVFLLAFRGNEWYRSTPWLFVPTERADAVERILDAALTRSDGPDRASVPERIVLALVGGSSLFVGLAMALAGGESGGWALAVVAAPLSFIFFALAARL